MSRVGKAPQLFVPMPILALLIACGKVLPVYSCMWSARRGGNRSSSQTFQTG